MINKLHKLGALGAVIGSLLFTTPPALVLVGTVGCASTKTEPVAYKTLRAVGKTGEAAIDTWLRYVVLKERSNAAIKDDAKRREAKTALLEQEAKVRSAYEKYRTAYGAAISTASLDANALAEADVIRLCADLASLVTQFTGNSVN